MKIELTINEIKALIVATRAMLAWMGTRTNDKELQKTLASLRTKLEESLSA